VQINTLDAWAYEAGRHAIVHPAWQPVESAYIKSLNG